MYRYPECKGTIFKYADLENSAKNSNILFQSSCFMTYRQVQRNRLVKQNVTNQQKQPTATMSTSGTKDIALADSACHFLNSLERRPAGNTLPVNNVMIRI